jgi:hypothetical protein
MNTNEAMAAPLAALARQMWLAIAAEVTRQPARCPVGRPAPARMPGDPRPRDDEIGPGGPAPGRSGGPQCTAPCRLTRRTRGRPPGVDRASRRACGG